MANELLTLAMVQAALSTKPVETLTPEEQDLLFPTEQPDAKFVPDSLTDAAVQTSVFRDGLPHYFADLRSAYRCFNAQFSYILEMNVVVDRKTLVLYRPGPFENYQFAPYYYRTIYEGKNGKEEMWMPFAHEWITSKGRFQRKKMTFKVGLKEVLKGAYNRWRPLPIPAMKGDLAWWDELLAFLFPRPEDAAAKKYFVQWLAFPFQWLSKKEVRQTVSCWYEDAR